MSTMFFMADTHFGHVRMCESTEERPKFEPGRPFATIAEHDQAIIDNVNRVVGKNDRLYILGDIAFNKRNLACVAALNGRKRAILGNHDVEDAKDYAALFEKVAGAKVLPDGLLLTHIPVHPSALTRQSMRWNVHGHLHEEVVTQRASQERWLIGDEDPHISFKDVPDPRYLCVSMEQIDYTPISLDEVKARLERQA